MPSGDNFVQFIFYYMSEIMLKVLYQITRPSTSYLAIMQIMYANIATYLMEASAITISIK